MLKLLVPVDGWESSNRAVQYVIRFVQRYGAAEADIIEVHLINVQPALSGDISMFVPKETIADFHQEQGRKDARLACALLDAVGVAYALHIGVGQVAETIVDYAREQQIDQIVMGSRGAGTIANLLLGSVASKVIHLAEVPVTLIK